MSFFTEAIAKRHSSSLQWGPADSRRLCIVSQYFPPEMGAPQVRLSELGACLAESGWQVEVLTALPNYPTGKVFHGYDPHKVCVEQHGRIRVVRVPLFTARTGFVRRLRSYFSFVNSAKRFGPKLCQRPDILYVESPPLFIGYAALYLAERWKCPFVLNVSDLWPESAVRMGVIRPGVLTRLAERLELRLYHRAAGVTGQSTEIVESIRRRSANTRALVITNGVSPARFGPSFADAEARRLIGFEAGPIFIYAGLFGLAQGLHQLVELAEAIPESIPGRLVLVGGGPLQEELQARADAHARSRLRILPVQPREQIPRLLAAADAAVVTLGMSIPGAVPSKLYEAMASSLPILLVADGEAARRVRDADCGLVVPPGDQQALLRAFRRLATDYLLRQRLALNGRRAAEEVYDRMAIARKLDRFLQGVLCHV